MFHDVNITLVKKLRRQKKKEKKQSVTILGDGGRGRVKLGVVTLSMIIFSNPSQKEVVYFFNLIFL